MIMEKIPELAGELVRVTRVTAQIAGADEVVRKKLLSMRTKVEKKILPPESCDCGSASWWRAHGQDQWRCQRCQPAPSRSLVAETRDQSPQLVSDFTVSCCMPWCPSWGSWLARDRVWSDWTYTIRCETCGGEMPDRPHMTATGMAVSE